MNYQDFLKKYIHDLKVAHPDWTHQKAFGEAAMLWSIYRNSGHMPPIDNPPVASTPPAPPEPPVVIQFIKNQTNTTLLVTEGDTLFATLYYVGQAHVWESMLKHVLDTVGTARFKEYVQQLVVLNNNLFK